MRSTTTSGTTRRTARSWWRWAIWTTAKRSTQGKVEDLFAVASTRSEAARGGDVLTEPAARRGSGVPGSLRRRRRVRRVACRVSDGVALASRTTTCWTWCPRRWEAGGHRRLFRRLVLDSGMATYVVVLQRDAAQDPGLFWVAVGSAGRRVAAGRGRRRRCARRSTDSVRTRLGEDSELRRIQRAAAVFVASSSRTRPRFRSGHEDRSVRGLGSQGGYKDARLPSWIPTPPWTATKRAGRGGRDAIMKPSARPGACGRSPSRPAPRRRHRERWRSHVGERVLPSGLTLLAAQQSPGGRPSPAMRPSRVTMRDEGAGGGWASPTSWVSASRKAPS